MRETKFYGLDGRTAKRADVIGCEFPVFGLGWDASGNAEGSSSGYLLMGFFLGTLNGCQLVAVKLTGVLLLATGD